jgi:hypothetical protein
MTLSVGTLSTRRRQPVRVITAVYPAQTRQQRRIMVRNAGHAGRILAMGIALIITAVTVFSARGSNDREASSAGLPVIVPEARSAPSQSGCPDVALRSGLCSVYVTDMAPRAYSLPALQSGEGRA